ncbi:MAG: alpha/beta hydrolase, partial [Opitutaceae bacterium]
AHRVAVNAFVKDIPLDASHPSMKALQDVESALPGFGDHPILIAWGGRDFCFDDRYLACWREVFHRADIERYADAGHYVLEDAGLDIRRRINEFLSG